MRQPSHWPADVQYLAAYTFHSSVSSTSKNFIQGYARTHDMQGYRSSYISIRTITDEKHPACGQRGLFAAKKIPPKTHLLDYIGEVHCDKRSESDYDLSLHRFPNGESIGIDASIMGNEGVKNKPNAWFVDRRTDSGELRMGVWTGKDEIAKGHEILVSYGKAYWRERVES